MPSAISRFNNWVVTVKNEDDPAIRILLLRTIVDQKILCLAALFWTQFCWIATFAMTGWFWLVVPIAIDILFFAIRQRIHHRPVMAEEPEPDFGLPDTFTIWLSILWMSMIATEVVVLFLVPSLRTAALGIILSIGFLGYVSSLYAAFPRLAAVTISLLAAGLTIGLASSPHTDLNILALLGPAAGLAYFVLTLRMHVSLLWAIRAQHQNRQRALQDPLTGLPNRVLMLERLARYCDLARDADDTERLGVLYLDLDGFKSINDRYGHAAGDMVLVHISKVIRAALRKQDTVSRLGGDEYVVLLPKIDDTALHAVIDRIIAAVNEPIEIGIMAPVHVGVSVGIARHHREGVTPEELLSRADSALYDAKRAGKGRYAFAA